MTIDEKFKVALSDIQIGCRAYMRFWGLFEKKPIDNPEVKMRVNMQDSIHAIIEYNPKWVEQTNPEILAVRICIEITRVLLHHTSTRKLEDPQYTYLASNIVCCDPALNTLFAFNVATIALSKTLPNDLNPAIRAQLPDYYDHSKHCVLEILYKMLQEKKQQDNHSGSGSGNQSQNKKDGTQDSGSDSSNQKKQKNNTELSPKQQQEQEEQNQQLQQSLSTENSQQQIEKWGENSIAESEVKRTVRSMRPDDWGMTRGDLVDRIIAANAQIIDTARPLKEFIATAHSAKMRSTLTRPNRFFPDQIGIIPGRKHSQRHKICLFGDKSGSMREHDLMLVATCINQYIKADCVVEFAWWDIKCEKPKPGLRMQPEFNVSEGGGGTNPGCIIQMLRDEKLDYDGLIILTDCKFGWARPKGYDNKIFIIGTPTCTKPPEWCKNRFMTMKDVELSLAAKNLV